MLAKMAELMHKVVEKDIKATHGQFTIDGKDFFFDLYQNKDALAAVHKMFRNTVLKSGQT